jgi:hypothetical protein
MSEETGPRYTWYMHTDEKRMDVTVAHCDEFAVINAMLSISRTFGDLAVIWAEPYGHAGQIVANGLVNLTAAQGSSSQQSRLPETKQIRQRQFATSRVYGLTRSTPRDPSRAMPGSMNRVTAEDLEECSNGTTARK